MLHYLIVVFVFLLIVWLVIGIHELGHFFAAKLLGVKVLCYSVGFGKKLFTFKGKTGTEYALSAIPIGGYVKLLDEREGPVSSSEKRYAFNRQSGIKKIAILLAGVFCNMLLGFLAYWWMFSLGFTTIMPVIGQVRPGSVAALARLQPNQKILKIGSHVVSDWDSVMMSLFRYYGNDGVLRIDTQSMANPDVKEAHYLNLAKWHINELKPNPLNSLGIIPYAPPVPAVIEGFSEASALVQDRLKVGDLVLAIGNKKIGGWFDLVQYISKHPEEHMLFTIKRGEKILHIPLTIEGKYSLGFKKKGYLGVVNHFQWPSQFLNQNQYSIPKAFIRAYQESKNFIVLNLVIIGKLLVGKFSLQSLGGPITIFITTEAAIGLGLIATLNILAFINFTIAVVNLLPIPGLDGGQILFVLVEMIRRKPLSLQVQLLFYRLGLIFILVLLFIAVFNDVARLVV